MHDVKASARSGSIEALKGKSKLKFRFKYKMLVHLSIYMVIFVMLLRLLFLQQSSLVASIRLERIEKQLEEEERRYYVYDNINMKLPEIREMAHVGKEPRRGALGYKKWARRFQIYAQGELRWIETLEQHKLRTQNIAEAAFIIVPIPLGAGIFWGTKNDIVTALQQLFEEPYFQKYPERHVLITNNERLFRPIDTDLFLDCCGITLDIMRKIAPVTIVKDVDPYYYRYYLNIHAIGRHSDFATIKDYDGFIFQNCWNLGYSHEASNLGVDFHGTHGRKRN